MDIDFKPRAAASIGKDYTTTVNVDGHTLIVDEKEKYGGKDEGPDPYAYLLAALAGCTTITVRMYANRKGWPLEKIDCDVMHKKIHPRDCEDCDNDDTRIDHIFMKLRFHGDLDEAQIKRLEYIAGRCPVKKTLVAGVHVHTEVDQ